MAHENPAGSQFKVSLRGSSVVLLEPDVAKAFPDAESVNAALRMLIQVARPHGKNSGKDGKSGKNSGKNGRAGRKAKQRAKG